MAMCSLCLQDKELIKRSHIIPDFMYQEIFDDKHRLVRFSKDNFPRHSTPPTGEYESDLLCADCDNRLLGGFESYGRQVLYGGNIPVQMQNFRQSDGLTFTQVTGINYLKFKLFLLSLLWKASISKRDFFKNVQLGPYQEILRKMLLEKNPESHNAFPCRYW